MNRQKLVSQIRRYVPYNEQEEADKAVSYRITCNNGNQRTLINS